jgi:hypothetical protein
MMNNIQLESGKYGPRAVITSAWTDEMEGYLRQHRVVEIELNDGKGWKGNDIAFVARLNFLRGFKIIDLKIKSVEAIMSLSNLESLELIVYCKTKIDFAAFPLLKECSIEWHRGAESLLSCNTLNRLFINRYDGPDLRELAKLLHLTSLSIVGAQVRSLAGIEHLEALHELRLANLKKLTSLIGIENLKGLVDLEINTCPSIGSIEPIGSLRLLRKLSLNNDGPIKSFDPLRNLEHLESVLFYESTNILDGDLSPLVEKNLTRVSFQNRRHYTARREEFGTAYSR